MGLLRLALPRGWSVLVLRWPYDWEGDMELKSDTPKLTSKDHALYCHIWMAAAMISENKIGPILMSLLCLLGYFIRRYDEGKKPCP